MSHNPTHNSNVEFQWPTAQVEESDKSYQVCRIYEGISYIMWHRPIPRVPVYFVSRFLLPQALEIVTYITPWFLGLSWKM